jgi:hypothetical protein
MEPALMFFYEVGMPYIKVMGLLKRKHKYSERSLF